MTEEPFDLDYKRRLERKNRVAMRNSFRRIGFFVFLTVLAWILAASFVTVAADVVSSLGFPGQELCERYMLVINEVTLAVGLLFGLLALIGSRKEKPAVAPYSAGRFTVTLLIAFGLVLIGNLAGRLFVGGFDALTGIETTDTVSEMIFSADPLQMILMSGIVGPVLEELIFRKLIIDRVYRYGEKTAILTSAIFFALFHMNFGQVFYAFGVGLVFAYLYCRSGRWMLSTMAHSIFNLLSGVLTALLLIPASDALEALSAPNLSLEALEAILTENGPVLIAYLLYVFLLFGIEIAGVVLFFVKIRHVRLRRGAVELSARSRFSAIFLNIGILLAGVFLLAMTGYSLFM